MLKADTPPFSTIWFAMDCPFRDLSKKPKITEFGQLFTKYWWLKKRHFSENQGFTRWGKFRVVFRVFSMASFQSRDADKNLTNEQRRIIYEKLLGASINGHLPRQAMSNAADQFFVHRSTIKRIWDRGQWSSGGGTDAAANVDSFIKPNSGRKKIDRTEILQKIMSLPYKHRSTTRSIVAKSGVSKGYVHQNLW
jgi:hypothetical protein